MSDHLFQQFIRQQHEGGWNQNGEGLLPSRCPGGEQHRPGCHQITARKKWTKEDNKFAIT